MKITLSPEESEKVFYDSMCNVFGMNYHCGYGLELSYNKKHFNSSKSKLSDPCWEDILLQMLKDGYKLTLKDIDGEGEYTRSITIKDVHQRVQKTPCERLLNVLEERGDVIDSDVVIQTVFYKDIIFG